MKGDAEKLVAFLEGAQKRFIIPVYQRNYDWKKDNCVQLYDDLVTLIKENKPCHFFGSIVSYCHNKDVIIIDGQQRITTVSLIIIAMINAMKNGVLQAEDELLEDKLRETYIIDKFRKDERKVRLKPFRDDCIAFDNLIFNSPKDYIESSNVTINYRYFYDRMVRQKEITLDELNHAIESLEVIDILIEPEHGDDPQLIFESLNSTGLDLSEADKIRNYVLMGQPADLQETFYNNYWSRIEKNCGDSIDYFVRDYLTIHIGSIPNFKKIYSSFKNYAKKSDIEPILQKMTRFSLFYHQVKENDLGDDNLNEICRRLNSLDVSVQYPFLMAFLEYVTTEHLSMEEIIKVFSCLENYIFRRQICNLPSAAVNKIFVTLHGQVIKQKKAEDTYSSVLIYLLQSKALSGSFPKDDIFIQELFTKNIYAMPKRNRSYLFERLENGYSKEKNDVIDNLEKKILSVEHIMPQTLNNDWKEALGPDYERIHEDWLHTLPNLTLTAYNPNYSNKLFHEKKNMENGFAQSGLRLNQYISKFDKWTEDELKQRKEHLVKIVLDIWAYPISSFKPIDKDEEVISLSEDFSFTGRSIKSFSFLDTRYPTGDWAEMIETVFKLLYALEPSVLYAEANKSTLAWLKTKPFEYANKKIAEGLYLCTGCDTATKIRILKLILSKYGLDEDELTFTLQPQYNEDETPSLFSMND